MLYENWKDQNSVTSGKGFKIYPEKCSVEINWKVNQKMVSQKIKGLKTTQFPVNSNITITGHTLQGQTKQHIIIGTGNYRCRNQVYVVLSRVNTLNRLLLTNKLNYDLAKFQISDDVLKEDNILDILDKTFQEDIKWEQTNICFGSNEYYYN